MPEQTLPETVEISDGQISTITIKRVGYSGQGVIYQTLDSKAYYRLLPNEQMPIRRRNQLSKWLDGKHGACFAHPTKRGHLEGFYLLRYDTPMQATPLNTLMARGDVFTRLDYFLNVFETFIQHPQNTEEFLPYPTDMIVTHDKRVLFLGMPHWVDLDVRDVMVHKERTLFLTPQNIRGQNVDFADAQWYILGCLLWLCFHRPNDNASVPMFLRYAASGTLLKSSYFEEDVFFWLKRVAAYDDLLQLAAQWINADPTTRQEFRTRYSPTTLASMLRQHRKALVPEHSVQQLRTSNRSTEALELIRAILLTEKSYDLLVLGAEAAWHDLDEYLEAIDFLEQAIVLDPNKETAYDQQFNLLVENHMQIFLSELVSQLEGDRERKLNIEHIVRQFGEKVERDYNKLSEEKQDQEEEPYAQYLVWQYKLDDAQRFIYPRLFEGDKFLWWKFGLNLVYLEILIKKRDFPGADRQMQTIKNGLIKVRKSGAMPEDERHHYGQRLTELETLLFQLKKLN